MTAAQCLAKAREADALARRHLDPVLREVCIDTANDWRRAAIMAHRQELLKRVRPGP